MTFQIDTLTARRVFPYPWEAAGNPFLPLEGWKPVGIDKHFQGIGQVILAEMGPCPV